MAQYTKEPVSIDKFGRYVYECDMCFNEFPLQKETTKVQILCPSCRPGKNGQLSAIKSMKCSGCSCQFIPPKEHYEGNKPRCQQCRSRNKTMTPNLLVEGLRFCSNASCGMIFATHYKGKKPLCDKCQ